MCVCVCVCVCVWRAKRPCPPTWRRCHHPSQSCFLPPLLPDILRHIIPIISRQIPVSPLNAHEKCAKHFNVTSSACFSGITNEREQCHTKRILIKTIQFYLNISRWSSQYMQCNKRYYLYLWSVRVNLRHPFTLMEVITKYFGLTGF